MSKLFIGFFVFFLIFYLDNNKISNIFDEYFKRFNGLQYLRLFYNELVDGGIFGNFFNVFFLFELDFFYNKFKNISIVNENFENYYLEVNEFESKQKVVFVFYCYFFKFKCLSCVI